MILSKIKALCEERKMSIAGLEKAVGLSNGTIGRWGKASPRLSSLIAVADYFGVTVGELLEEEKPRVN